MFLLGLLLTPGCAIRSKPGTLPSSGFDDAAVRAQTRSLFEAYDQRDAARFEPLIADGFVLFDNLREFDGSYLLERLREPRTEAPRTRVCQEDSYARGRSFVVHTAQCVERWSTESGPVERTGWNTVAWIRDGNAWRAAHWNWKPGGVTAEREMWNETFARGTGFRHDANQLLVDTVRGLPAGSALDLMTGQGRNALYLASQGWKTTGVDISDVGLRAAAHAARKGGLALELIEADLDGFDLGVDRWDLVTMIYAGSDAALIARAKSAIRPGGRFVAEFFLKDGGPMGFARGELAAQFKDWHIERDEVVEDIADWSKQRTQLVRFVARKPAT